ncbi:MFS transporter [Spirillospora sp. CA-294931]|uniref:MFS transporter n=1 Tax=Spirillospora sp. CA-294931 TaxID=3240042 RepID=UPI003D946DE5
MARPRVREFLPLVQVVSFAEWVGTGLFLTVSTIYFVKVVGLSSGAIGAGLSIAGVAAMGAALFVGRLADRYGPRRVFVGVNLMRAIATLGYLWVGAWWSFLAVAVVVVAAEQVSAPLVQAYVRVRVSEDLRGRVMAMQRTTLNVGSALGGLVGALALGSADRTSCRRLLVGVAVIYLVTALLPLVSKENVGAGRGRGGLGSILSDVRLLGLTSYNALLSLWSALIYVALPLWLVTRTDVPERALAGLFMVNTVICICLQYFLNRCFGSLRRAWFCYAVVCVIIAGACLMLAVAPFFAERGALVALTIAIVLLTFAELLQVGAAWTLSFSLAPEDAPGSYLMVFGVGRTLANRVVGPVLMTGVVFALGTAGWIGLSVVFVLGAIVPFAVLRRLRPMSDVSFVSLFAKQVAERPDGPALIHGDRVITYRELDLWSGRLAARLAGCGVEAGDLVALAAHRGSPAATAGVLAVLKAGAGYVGLDPAIPDHRQELILRETGPGCLLAEPGLDRFPDLVVPRVVLGPLAEGPVLSEFPAFEASRVFHVVYTSGTTGDPKGVRVSYAAVLNRLAWTWSDYPFPPGAVVASHKSIALVATTWEMLGGLLQGVPSVVLGRDEVMDPVQFVDAIERWKLTHLFLTPPLIAGLLDEVERRGPAHAPVFVTSGADALPVETALRFRRVFPAATLLNLYGMSETSSVVASYDVAALGSDAERVPVGVPVAGASISVLDPSGGEVAPGEVGEIWISGPPVALGYLNAREAGRFVRAADGTVSYRTGDRGRFLPTGDLEIVGRVDNQVKIRGYRVELKEVEAALLAAPWVTGAVVHLDEDADEPRLVGCVTTGGETGPATRAFVRERLPEYMVPAEVVVLPSLPFGPNGKLDRSELKARLAGLRRPGLTPGDDIEATVAGIWVELLGSPPADRADNFFESGGNSLLAVRLINRVELTFGLRLTPRQVFRSPTFTGIVGLCRPAGTAS